VNAFRTEVLKRRAKLPQSPETEEWGDIAEWDDEMEAAFVAYQGPHTEFMRWYRRALYDVDLSKPLVCVEIRCGVVVAPNGRRCRELMGQVLHTPLGGMFLQKHRVDNGKTMDKLDKEHGELYDEWMANFYPGGSREEYEEFVGTRRVTRREGRYLIWEKDQEPAHPLPEHLALSRHAVCKKHGIYPFDRLDLEKHYELWRRTWSLEEVTCSDAWMPPLGLREAEFSIWGSR
jgi:hypothetical protein